MNPKITMVIRILLGLFLVAFGLNKFFGFMPMPEMGDPAGTLMGIYASTGFIKMIGGLELLGGVALLVNKFVPLALVFIVAILFNVITFHIFNNDLGNIGGGALSLILSLVLVYANKERFNSILSM